MWSPDSPSRESIQLDWPGLGILHRGPWVVSLFIHTQVCMKPLNFLLFTIVSLGGGSEAAPSGGTLRNRTVNTQFNAQDAHPVLTTPVLAPQARSCQLYTSQGWQDDKDVTANQLQPPFLERCMSLAFSLPLF